MPSCAMTLLSFRLRRAMSFLDIFTRFDCLTLQDLNEGEKAFKMPISHTRTNVELNHPIIDEFRCNGLPWTTTIDS